MKHRDILNIYFCKDKIQIPTIGPEKIANFQFSHYKSMETIATRVLIRQEKKKQHKLCRGYCQEPVYKVQDSST